MKRGAVNEYLLAVGTYTEGTSTGLYFYALEPEKEGFTPLSRIEVADPSYIAIGKDGKCVYTVTENPQPPAYANSFFIGKQTGNLYRKSRKETGGAGPCYIAADPEYRFVATANYAGGSISVFSLTKEGDINSLSQIISFSGHGKDPERQESPHIHCIGFSPENKYLFASDLGTDNIYRFDIEHDSQTIFLRESSLKSFPVEAGSGPRHFRFSPDGKYFYLINELSGTVMVFSYENGDIIQRQKLPIPTKEGGDGGDIILTPDGKYLYASMREGSDGIGVFAVDRTSGLLTKTDYFRTAKHPRNLSISPDGRFLLCSAMKDNIIEVYSIDPDTGVPGKTNARVKIDAPACTAFLY